MIAAKPRALDLYCCAGGMSVGLERAGFDVTGIDINAQPHYKGGRFIQADALEVLLDLAFLRSFDFIHASPPCQAHSSLRHLQKGKVYPDLIPQTRVRLIASGVPYSIENVEGAPLGGFLTMLCGTMFGLQTPDGRAEIRRHRLFETSWPIALRPACQHGHEPLTVTGHTPVHGTERRAVRREAHSVNGTGLDSGKERWEKRRALSVSGHAYEVSPTNWPGQRRAITVTGGTPQTNTVHNSVRTNFSVADARAAMQIDWMPMKSLSQAIPPAYGEWIGRQALAYLAARTVASGS